MTDRIGQQLGHYRLIQYVGGGGFADVYLGEHIHLNTWAAIKVLHARLSGTELERFREEARIIARLAHPGIVRVLDFGVDETTPFLVMEYAPKGSLRKWHAKGTRLPLQVVITYVKQIANSLQYAHEQKIIHRDVKPENMLVNQRDEVVLSDFGLALYAHSSQSQDIEEVGGTATYMAPEQIHGKPRPASDQYALGIVVYEWLCGEPPFQGQTLELWGQHMFAPVPSLREKVPTVPPMLEEVVLTALSKDPKQRFRNMHAFALALEQASQEKWPQPFIVPAVPVHIPPLPLSNRTQLEVAQTEAPQSKQIPSSRDRLRMLERVRTIWVSGLLEQSLQGAALIAVGFEEKPDFVVNPWRLVVQELDRPERTLPSGTRITQVYDEADGELLILGEPGAGKTTLLLELARDLLERAKQNETLPIPIVFNLSSWAFKRLELTDWLVEELGIKYQVPRELGQAWITTDQVLPLLDGLDELATNFRTACVDAINAYRHRHGLVPLVVCSRSADYITQSNRLQLHSAVVIQPLTAEQINSYISSAGEQLEAVRIARRDDPLLQTLITTPLMLSVLVLAYHGLSVENLPRAQSVLTLQKKVFATYVTRMIERRGISSRYNLDQTKRWLSWLAWQLAQRSQTEFYPELLQSNWLSNDEIRQSYRTMIMELACGMISGLLVGVLIGIVVGFFIALIGGLVAGLLGGLLGRWYGRQVEELRSDRDLESEQIDKLYSDFDSELIKNLHSNPESNIVVGLYAKLGSALLGGLFIGLLFVLVGGLAGGLLVGIIYGLIYLGIAYIQHYVLRFLLWRTGSIPWNYRRFLDHVVDRILLRRVGGGYIFIHQLLRDYFSTLYTEQTSGEGTQTKDV